MPRATAKCQRRSLNRRILHGHIAIRKGITGAGRRRHALITSLGHASSSVERCWPNTDCAYLVTNGFPVLACEDVAVRTCPRPPARRRCGRDVPNPCFGLNLEHESRLNGPSVVTARAVDVERTVGRGASSASTSSSWLTPKFSAADVNSTV